MPRGANPQSRFKTLGVLTVPFGEKTLQEEKHGGVDFANQGGTPIPAFAGGVVTRVIGGRKHGDNNFGNTVEIKDESGNLHQYHHLQSIAAKQGSIVKKGDQIATMGKTGATYSPSGGDPTHLDYRIVSRYGKYKNPISYVKNFYKNSNKSA